MPTPPVPGPLLLLGDSITVRLYPFVQATGPKRTLAEGGKTAAWLLPKLRELEAAGGLDDGTRTATVLLGTNDVSWGMTAEEIFTNIRSIWEILAHHGIRVLAMTVPPQRGWSYPPGVFEAVDQKRRKLNDLMRKAAIPDQPGRPPETASKLILLDEISADPTDPSRLAPGWDAGDHLHLRKDRLGALLQAEASGLPVTPPGPSPATPSVPVPPSSSNVLLYVGAGGILLGGLWALARKRQHGAYSSSRRLSYL